MEDFYKYYINILLDIIELDDKIETVLVEISDGLQTNKSEITLKSLVLRLENLRDDRFNKYEQLNKITEAIENEE